MTGSRPTGRLRARWERTPLRVRLVGTVLLLVTMALLMTSVANVTAMRGYMLDQVDQGLWDRMDAGFVESMTNYRKDYDSDLVSNYVSLVGPVAEVQSFKGTFAENRMPDLTGVDFHAVDGTPFTAPAHDGSLRWRVLSLLADPTETGGGVKALATPLTEVDTAVARLLWIELLVGAGVVVGIAAIGVALVRASLGPLKEIEHTAVAITAGDLAQRVPLRDRRTEVGRLGEAMNIMLGRIEAALRAREASERRALASENRMRRFVADASHELRSPLTTVRGFAELYRQQGEVDSEEAERMMARIEEEAKRMGLLVEDLLLLARLDRERTVESRRVDLLSVAVDTVSAAELNSEDHELEVSTRGGPFIVSGDDLQLRQVAANLVTNAMRHTPAGTRVDVRLRIEHDCVVLEIADDGPGMSSEQAERVFERFYRVDKARSRAVGGTGLGLAIVAAIVEAHNGSVALRTAPGEGAAFEVWLPVAPEDRELDAS